jgi:hypothetical protein
MELLDFSAKVIEKVAGFHGCTVSRFWRFSEISTLQP